MGGVQGPGQVQDHPRYLLSRCEGRCGPVLSLSRGLWRSLVSASVWGTEGRRFKSSQPDKCDVSRHRKGVNLRGAGFLGLVLGLVVAAWVEG